MVPVCKVQDDLGEILVADSGEPFYGTNEEGILGRWYRTGYAINRDGLDIGNFCDYPAEEFGDLSRRDGQERRVNECLIAARETLKQFEEVGRYA